MSIYAVNKLCREALRDAAFRAALKRDPRAAIAPLPLTGEERSALLNGDVAWLYEQGAHPFLLAYLTRWELFGLTVALYSERIRTAREPAITEQYDGPIRSISLVSLPRHRRPPAGGVAERRQGGRLGHPQYRAFPLGDR